ncbi:MAG: DUF6531 domain-containing protein [Burkholderiales bacterium]|nr:DUF6531 domain-containing protein [Burkholderiales bacterium]
MNGNVASADPLDPDCNGACTVAINNLPARNAGQPCPAVGNPVNPATGNKYQAETVYTGSGALPLTLTLAYNRTLGGWVAWGAKWKSNYERSLTRAFSNGFTYINAVRPDGKTFQFMPTTSGWMPDADIPDALVELNTSGATTGWKYTTSNDEVETYNASGQLTSIANRAGLTHTLTYDTSNRLWKVTDSAGRQLTFTYDVTNRVRGMTDPAGGVYSFTYDTTGGNPNNLVSISFPDTSVRTFWYENATYTGAFTGIVDENGTRYGTYTYDSTGRAIASEHASGGIDRHTLAYGTNATTVTDPLGTPRTYNFTTILGVVKSTGQSQPGGSGCGAAASSLTYDPNGNISSRTDFNGNKTCYAYDMGRNLETARAEGLAGGGVCPADLAAWTPAAGTVQRKVATQWHATYRLPTLVTEAGRVTAYAYDTQGNLLNKTVTDTASGQTRSWTYTYTTAADGTLANLLKTVDGPRTDVADVATYGYAANGDLASVTNALGQVTAIGPYDANGRPLAVTDPNGLVTTLAYTPRGWLRSRTVGTEATVYDYDGVGQLTRVTLPDGSSIAYTYDAAHRLTDITDAQGNRIHYTLDAIGNRTREDVSDATGNLAQTRSRVFDALNRLWKDVGALNQTTVYEYDANGNLTKVTDPLNHATVNAYDALNRLSRSTDALNGVTQYAYDPLDQLRSVTDPRGLVTQYSVNALGDQVGLVSPDTGAASSTFDAAGNLKTRQDARGQTATYSYDALNRLTRIAYSDGAAVDYRYDQGTNGIGRLTGMTDAAGTTVWSYTAQGKLAAKTQTVAGVTRILAYGYDAAGRLASLTYPSGKTLSYGYDAAGRIAGISVDGVVLLANVQYQPFGPARSWSWGNGSAYSRSFDSDGRIAGYPLGASQRSLSFDAAGRIVGLADTNPVAGQSLGYDALDRLTSWVAPTTSQSYGHDADGNRTSLTVGASGYANTVAADSNRLLAVGGPQARNLAYDAAGNLTGDGNNSFGYNAAGRLAAVTNTWGTTGYLINGLGQRLAKTAPSGATYFLYDEAGRLVGEYDPGGGPLTETVYLGDIPVAVMR